MQRWAIAVLDGDRGREKRLLGLATRVAQLSKTTKPVAADSVGDPRTKAGPALNVPSVPVSRIGQNSLGGASSGVVCPHDSRLLFRSIAVSADLAVTVI